jgi:hypothetical protein
LIRQLAERAAAEGLQLTGEGSQGAGGTLRRHLICVPARIARHDRRHITLHLPEHWRWQPAWINAFDAVHHPPPARAA